jgi:hypothetical protein
MLGMAESDPSVFYVSIDELPNPRDWGTVDLIAGNKLIFSEDIDLAAPSIGAIKALIAQYWHASRGLSTHLADAGRRYR